MTWVADGRVVDRIHGAPRASREQVSVDLQGEGGGVVAELLLHVREGSPASISRLA
jgi:hypothetical protein